MDRGGDLSHVSRLLQFAHRRRPLPLASARLGISEAFSLGALDRFRRVAPV